MMALTIFCWNGKAISQESSTSWVEAADEAGVLTDKNRIFFEAMDKFECKTENSRSSPLNS